MSEADGSAFALAVEPQQDERFPNSSAVVPEKHPRHRLSSGSIPEKLISEHHFALSRRKMMRLQMKALVAGFS